jgi:hypothetical protein
MNVIDYTEHVMEILETFDYPAMVVSYQEEGVARTMSETIAQCYEHELSPMMCAIIIWSLTMTMKIIPEAKASTKH